MPLIIPTNSISDLGYNVDNSLRFDDGSTDNLSKTFSASNRRTFTFSAWIKIGDQSANQSLFTGRSSGSDYATIRIESNGKFHIFDISTSFVYQVKTNRVLRDTSAWYHLVVAFDSTQSTASNRIKMYVNGQQETDLAESSYPSENYQSFFNNNLTHYVGLGGNLGDAYDGYMSEVCFIDGQALDPTSFGEFDEDTGIWKPIDVSGLTFGTNGFYLPFENSGALGQDDSGNGNNFTVNNLTSIDQTTDTPTNNFCTMNPLASESGITFAEGNLKITSSTDGAGCGSTMAVKSGKWYFEVKYSDNANYGIGLGRTTEYTSSVGYTSTSYNIDKGGNKTHNSSFSNIFSLSGSNIIGFALDCDNQKIHFSQNGNWYNNNNSSTTLDPNNPDYSSVNVNEELFAIYSHFSTSSATVEFNFGNPTFSISSGNSDGNGYGNFEYAVPSGYYALNTKNLAEYG